jgi:sterol desaturase/sphingolipid hydroxylase (fatty acid hydroxylase superfamily)
MTFPPLDTGTITHLGELIRSRITGPNGVTLILLWATVILAAVVTYGASSEGRASLRDFWRYLLPGSIFRHPSARADFLFWLSRRLTMPLLVVPLSLSTAVAGYGTHRMLELVVGPGSPAVAPPGPAKLCLFALTMLLAYDLSYYLYHCLQHKIPLLWELHKVHHSAEVMVGVTKDRVHPLDDLMNHWWDGLIPGAVYGVWLFFMTPHWHQLHHSSDPKHFDKNFGLMLSVWDRIFGTLMIPERGEDFVFGLAENEHAEYQSLLRLYVRPLSRIGTMVRASLPSHTRPEKVDMRAGAGALRPTTKA